MEVDRKVIVEPAGKSEADWTSDSRSSTELPPFVEGEFEQLLSAEGKQMPGEKTALRAHMARLLGFDDATGDAPEGAETANPPARGLNSE